MMSEINEGKLEVLLDNFSPLPDEFEDLLRENMSGEASQLTGGHRHSELRDGALQMLANAVVAPSCGQLVSCSCPKASGLSSLQSVELQHHFFLDRVDELEEGLVSGKSHLDRVALTAAVSSLLFTCQPYFNHLESIGRSNTPLCAHMPADYCSRLLDFSQQLCERLEQLLLTYACYDLISLDEADPNSTSHFCVGQLQLGQTKLTTFRYCKPTPYLSQVDTGVQKRMRWNVERLPEDGEQEEIQTDYYFLCYEDIPNPHADPESRDTSNNDVVRMWSIGQWVQINPEPTAEDIYDWILCEVPEASYHRLLFLGPNEPPSSMATDYLQQLLLQLAHQTD